jgi:NAD(P)H-hydrate repair Nnr-like enzyme with NAD(P)H-hydrate epimerase domain
MSSLRVLVFCGSGGGGGDSVVCGSITIGNRQPTEVMPINLQQVWKCRWAKIGGCVCVVQIETRRGRRGIRRGRRGVVADCDWKEGTDETKGLKMTGECGVKCGQSK